MLKRLGLWSACSTFLILTLWSLAHAQEAPTPPAFDLKGLLDAAVHTLLPALWLAVGPMTVAAITAGVNSLSKQYVPRAIQVILSSVVTAVAVGLTGGEAFQGLVAGAGAQALAATKPETLLTSKKPELEPAHAPVDKMQDLTS